MNLKKLFFRDEQQVSVDVYEAWAVRWTSRFGRFASDTQPELKVFTSEEDAKLFAKALKDAFALINHTSDAHVSISKQ